jgi:transcriptional regulator with XRE-family HTH domain
MLLPAQRFWEVSMTAKEAMTLAGRLREMRKIAGLSQQDLAVKAGLSMAVVSQIEQGKKMDPRMSTVTSLAEALGVDVGELVGQRAGKPRSRNRK